MLWINFLHLYQPIHIDAYHTKEATEKSYLRVIKALEKNPQIKFTANINGCLILRWEELGYGDLIKRINRLVKNGNLEITGNAAYHPLLPLVSNMEAEKQILETESILKKHFGSDFKPKGFFFSEMAYGEKTAKLVKSLGYEWLILDEISRTGKLEKHDFNNVYQDENSGLKAIFRSRELSNTFVPDTIKNLLKKNNNIAITATDGELYGLRYIDQSGKFENLLKEQGLKTMAISDFIAKKEKTVNVRIVNSNWESSEKELKKNKPYALWQDKSKKIQNKLWELADLAYDAIEKGEKDINYAWARWHLVRGLSSCTFWWASEKDFKKSFGPLAWNPDEIERGTNELIRSVRALENENTRELKIKAEKLYIEIKKNIWKKHWNYYWKK